MKLLHTSDWHLGARLGRHDRSMDHRVALQGLVQTAKTSAPDLILHTGDVFDSSRPSDAAMLLGFQALSELARIAPTVVIAGNHDSPRLLAALHDLLDSGERRRLWMIAAPSVVTVDVLPDVAIACMPFVPPTVLAELATGDLARFEGDYADGVRLWNQQLLDEATAAVGPRGIVLYAAHLHVHGARPGRSERRITVGEDYATHVEGLHRAVYAAFGHIHDPQLLPGGTVNGRYAGSLIPIDFGEATQTKHTVLVDLADGVPRVEEVPLPGGRPLTEFHGTLDELEQRAADGALDGHLLKARVVSDDPIPDLADRLADWSPGCAVFDLVNDVRRQRVAPVDTSAEPGEEPDVSALFAEWRATAARGVTAPDRAVLDLFGRALGTEPADLGLDATVSRANGALDALAAADQE